MLGDVHIEKLIAHPLRGDALKLLGGDARAPDADLDGLDLLGGNQPPDGALGNANLARKQRDGIDAASVLGRKGVVSLPCSL